MIGPKEGDGKIRAGVIEKTDSATLKGFVVSNVEAGATAFTDEHWGYRGLSASLGHEPVGHSVDQYVNGMARTNGIESFWAMLKRDYEGINHKMSEASSALCHRVCRSPQRPQPRHHRPTTLLAKGLDGKRLRHDDLVAANG